VVRHGACARWLSVRGWGGAELCDRRAGLRDTVPFSITHAIGHSNVNTGWVVGSGTEGKLLIPGWTYRIEGLYMDLGHLDDTDVALPTIKSVTGGQTFTHTHFTDTILRLGVNYQFH
jgi:opacity protein-like surface antigen